MSKIRHVWILLCLLAMTFTAAAQEDARLLYEGGEDYARSIAISPDGRTLAIGTMNGHTLVLDLQTGAEVYRFAARNAAVTAVVFAADGALWNSTIANEDGGDYALRLYDLHNGEVVRLIPGNQSIYPYAVAVSPDSQYLFYVTNGSQGNLRDIAASQTAQTFVGHTGIVWDAAFSPDGRYVVTGSEDEQQAVDNMARLWDVETGLEIQRFAGHTGGVRSVAFAPDGQTVLTGSSDGTARLWDVETGAVIHTMTHDDTVSSVAFSPDGHWLITGSWDGTVRLWDAQTGAENARFESGWVSALAVSGDGLLIVGAGDGTVRALPLGE